LKSELVGYKYFGPPLTHRTRAFKAVTSVFPDERRVEFVKQAKLAGHTEDSIEKIGLGAFIRWIDDAALMTERVVDRADLFKLATTSNSPGEDSGGAGRGKIAPPTINPFSGMGGVSKQNAPKEKGNGKGKEGTCGGKHSATDHQVYSTILASYVLVAGKFPPYCDCPKCGMRHPTVAMENGDPVCPNELCKLRADENPKVNVETLRCFSRCKCMQPCPYFKLVLKQLRDKDLRPSDAFGQFRKVTKEKGYKLPANYDKYVAAAQSSIEAVLGKDGKMGNAKYSVKRLNKLITDIPAFEEMICELAPGAASETPAAGGIDGTNGTDGPVEGALPAPPLLRMSRPFNNTVLSKPKAPGG